MLCYDKFILLLTCFPCLRHGALTPIFQRSLQLFLLIFLQIEHLIELNPKHTHQVMQHEVGQYLSRVHARRR